MPRNVTDLVYDSTRGWRTYTGPVDGEGRPHGMGRSVQTDQQALAFDQQSCIGNTHGGEYVQGVMEGRGTLRLDGIFTHDGAFARDVRSGPGFCQCDNGDQYVGAHSGGRRHGHGCATKLSGYRYQGQYMGDERCGHGVARYGDGACYAGSFEAVEGWHGIGIVTQPDGLRHEGSFIDDGMDGFGMRSMDTTGERFEGWFTAGALQSGLHILGDGRKVLVQHSDMTAALDTTTGAAAWRTHSPTPIRCRPTRGDGGPDPADAGAAASAARIHQA